MKSAWFSMLTALFLSGCSQKSAVEEVVQNHLKDPTSAIFKDYVASDGNQYACISWNAKNSFGGYTGWDVAFLKKENGVWIVESMKHAPCSKEDLNSFEEIDNTMEQITGIPK
ncbi:MULTISPECIES: hypothetical protein [unclassified Methylophilus]|uniref:hypothetical protein n=1 Tax=unclassified Methylophilus TaxID=2630143 RepID=UPI0006FC9365|nr:MULTISPECIES: hypothetical protein [unclassified Methylophilus]KQT42519.1 hypothetical protein ASG34_07185 [Methylophilus sp. Leaf416]KQT56702.1 hypothetical protein ASG44_07160 [Methylophilus sp. Leaf459]